MPDKHSKWSLRRWRRQWNSRVAAWSLRWRIWFDRHILSHKKRQKWRQRWHRRTERLGRAIENVGYKVMPAQPDAAPETRWTKLQKKIEAFIDERIYPPEARVRHARAFRDWWHEFTAPFHHANTRVRHALDAYLLPSLTPLGFQKRFVNWKGLVVLAALAGLVAGTALWLVPNWALHNKQKWAAQARLLLSRGYYSLAYQNAARVLRRDQNNAEASQVVADMLERQGLAEALTWRRRVVEIDDSSTNRLALAATALRFEPSPSATAAGILAATTGPTTNSMQYHAVAAQFEFKRGNLSAAENHYLAALINDPADAEMELALAVLRAQTRDEAKLAAARLTLETLSTRTNIGVRALRPLVVLATARGDLDSARHYSDQILTFENSTFDDRLAHLSILTRKSDPERAKFLRTLQEQVSANPLFVAQLCGWMTANNEARPAIDWVKGLAPAVRKAEPVMISTADAYAAQGDWQGMEQFLSEQSWGTVEYVRQAMFARAYRGLGNSRACAENLRRATHLASGMSLRLTSLARLVSGWGWERETEDLIWTVAERFPKERWASELLVRRFTERGDTDALRRVYALQFKTAPNDLEIKNNLAMVLLLLRVDLPTAHQLALEVHLKNPKAAVTTSTYAFSLFVQGQTAEGRRMLESLGPEVLKVPSIAAYYAILADASGDHATALKFIGQARLAKLLPEEKAMLDKIQRQP